MAFVLNLVVLGLIYAISATAENFAVGYSGQFSAAQGAIFGLGAYVYASSFVSKWPLALALLAVLLAGVVVGSTLSFVAGRVRGHSFMIVTLAFQLVIVDVANNLRSVTGGVQGEGGLRPISLGSFVPTSPGTWAVVTLVVAVVVGLLCYGIIRTRWPIVWKAIREDESATASVGRGPVGYKVLAFGVASAGTAMAGALYGSYISYIDPGDFTVAFSIFIISAIIVGGIGNPIGPLVGVTVLTALQAGLTFVPDLPVELQGELIQALYAVALLVFVALRPQGILPEGTLRRWRTRRARPTELESVVAETEPVS